MRPTVEVTKFLVGQGACELTCAIGSEVEENDRIPAPNTGIGIRINNGGKNELIRSAGLIRGLHYLQRTFCPFPLQSDQSPVCFAYSLPTLISIHRIVHRRPWQSYPDPPPPEIPS